MERRLAAILAADLVGYSRLIREDEERTIGELRTLIVDVIAPAIKAHGGRLVKTMGDGVLAEFPSVVGATASAALIQTNITARNAASPTARVMHFRIGINLGDVVLDGDDIHGDGVNVAARLESMAPEGGIAVSAAVHDQVCNRLELIFSDQGPQYFKNIDVPMSVWTWKPAATISRQISGASPHQPTEKSDNRPSIAVLPFENMSGDPEQEYFADGIADDITIALSRSKWLFVVARNSSFNYRGRQADLRRVAMELGVRFLLQGSLRKSGKRLRITAQLIRANDGHQVWAEKYDGKLEDVFDFQDEITHGVVGSLLEKIRTSDALPSLDGERNQDLRHWDLIRQIWKPFYELSPKSLETALKLTERVLNDVPDSWEALWIIAGIEFHQVHLGYRKDPDQSILKRCLRNVRRSVELEDRNEFAHWTAGLILLYLRDFRAAIAEIERSIELNPNFSLGYGSLGTVLAYFGEADRSIENNTICMRHNPMDSSLFLRHTGLALAHLTARRFDQSENWARKVVMRRPEYDLGHGLLIASLALSGQLDEAQQAVSTFLKAFPAACVQDFSRVPIAHPEHFELLADGLRIAGLPDSSGLRVVRS